MDIQLPKITDLTVAAMALTTIRPKWLILQGEGWSVGIIVIDIVRSHSLFLVWSMYLQVQFAIYRNNAYRNNFFRYILLNWCIFVTCLMCSTTQITCSVSLHAFSLLNKNHMLFSPNCKTKKSNANFISACSFLVFQTNHFDSNMHILRLLYFHEKFFKWILFVSEQMKSVSLHSTHRYFSFLMVPRSWKKTKCLIGLHKESDWW